MAGGCIKPGLLTLMASLIVENCYQRLFQYACDTCTKPITGPYVDLFGRRFHADCFLCDGCKAPLSGHCVKKPQEKKAYCRKCAVGEHNDGRKLGGFIVDQRTGKKKYAS